MKTYLDCIPSMMEQALQTGCIATNDESRIKELMDAVGNRIKHIPLGNTPPETGKGLLIVTGRWHPAMDKSLAVVVQFGNIYGIVGGLHGFANMTYLKIYSLFVPRIVPSTFKNLKNDFLKNISKAVQVR